MSKPIVTIKYETIAHSGRVLWSLEYDRPNGKRLFVTNENGAESNKRKAQKAAEHARRLTQAALDKGR